MNPNTQDVRVISKRTNNALDRLDRVEAEFKRLDQSFGGLVTEVNNSLGPLSQQATVQAEYMEAVVELIGKDRVEAWVKETRSKRMAEAVEAEKKAIEELKAKGDLVAVDKISEVSILVGKEFDAAGNVRPPGRAQVAFERVSPEFKTQLLGQGVGFKMPLPNGGTFEVLEVYELAKKPVEAATAVVDAAIPAPVTTAPEATV